MIFVIPDTHLGHENIKKYCNRPDNFEALIEKNWNAAVGESDTVIHLGDVSFKDFWVKRLGSWRGRKILVRGNHDKMPPDFYMSCGFAAVVEELVMDLDNVVILFSHRPKFGHECDINLHGHQHNLAVYDARRLYFPLSIEHMGYRPLPLEENFLGGLKKFVIGNRQPSLQEIMSLGQRAIGRPSAKDLYDGFGKEIFQQSRARLEECYEILENAPYNSARYKFRLWRNAVRYVEGKASKDEFAQKIRKFL